MPDWCRVTSMDNYRRRKYDKTKDELLSLWQHNQESWEVSRNKVVLKLEDFHSIQKLAKDIPDYVLESDVRGGTIIFPRGELEDFLGISMKVGWRRIFSQLGKER